MVRLDSYQGVSFLEQKNKFKHTNSNDQPTKICFASQSFIKPSIDNIKANFLSFTGTKQNNLRQLSFEKITECLDQNAYETWCNASELAIAYNNTEIQPLHYIYSVVKNAIDELSINDDYINNTLLTVIDKKYPRALENEYSKNQTKT